MLLDIPELNSHFFDITNIFPVRQKIDGKTSFTMHNPRPTDALLLFANTTGICYQKGMPPLYIPHGALVYMPQYSHYIWENSPAANSSVQENLLFEFTLRYVDTARVVSPKREIVRAEKYGERIAFGDRVTIITTHHTSLHKKLFNSLIEAFNAPQYSPLSVYSTAYEIFSTLSSNCRIEQENTADTRLIKNSIKYLEDVSDSAKTIGEIAESCNISIGYYERIFRSYAGISPSEYRSIHRINQIKMFLHEEQITLDAISEKMGYCDSGYLCRFFKRKTGMTPKEYRKIYLMQMQKKLID